MQRCKFHCLINNEVSHDLRCMDLAGKITLEPQPGRGRVKISLFFLRENFKLEGIPLLTFRMQMLVFWSRWIDLIKKKNCRLLIVFLKNNYFTLCTAGGRRLLLSALQASVKFYRLFRFVHTFELEFPYLDYRHYYHFLVNAFHFLPSLPPKGNPVMKGH